MAENNNNHQSAQRTEKTAEKLVRLLENGNFEELVDKCHRPVKKHGKNDEAKNGYNKLRYVTLRTREKPCVAENPIRHRTRYAFCKHDRKKECNEIEDCFCKALGEILDSRHKENCR